jgi:hypothetical protein
VDLKLFFRFGPLLMEQGQDLAYLASEEKELIFIPLPFPLRLFSFREKMPLQKVPVGL